MSAAELRQAAETLRARASAATPGEWIAFGHAIGVTVRGCTCDWGYRTDDAGFTVPVGLISLARLINGGAS